MNETQDTLRLLKNRFNAERGDLERKLAEVRTKLNFIDELEAEAAKLQKVSTPTDGLKYSNWKGTLLDSIKDALGNFKDGVTAPKLGKYLIDNGAKPNGDNFNVSIGTSLNRLVERGEATSEKVDKSRVYKPK